MQEFPHLYRVIADGVPGADVVVRSHGLPTLPTATPAEFDGPGDLWSPETFLVAAVGDCLALTFRGIARRSKLAWTSLACDVTGVLDCVDGVTQFVRFDVTARVQLPPDGDSELARRVLDKAERNCLIASSLKGAVRMIAEIEVGGQAVAELSAR